MLSIAFLSVALAAPLPAKFEPFKPGIVYVNVVSNKGHDLKKCAEKAIDVAKRLGCHVGFLHEGIQLIATPESTANAIAKLWKEHYDALYPPEPIPAKQRCEACEGIGEIQEADLQRPGKTIWLPCEKCKGTGRKRK